MSGGLKEGLADAISFLCQMLRKSPAPSTMPMAHTLKEKSSVNSTVPVRTSPPDLSEASSPQLEDQAQGEPAGGVPTAEMTVVRCSFWFILSAAHPRKGFLEITDSEEW